eukprot:2863140-Amphidinium_carterae.1
MASRSTLTEPLGQLTAWSNLWQPRSTTFPRRRTDDLGSIVTHCRLGKALGGDRWCMGELRLLPQEAYQDLASLLKTVEATGTWPTPIKEMLYLQLPKKVMKMLVSDALWRFFPMISRFGVLLAAKTSKLGGP